MQPDNGTISQFLVKQRNAGQEIMADISHTLEDRTKECRSLYSVKLSHKKENEIEMFLARQKVKEFIPDRCVL